uniref:Uncharacterized protein n=1 Tax=Eutreptiella gymnastica TaxID=73025 RepID=A0A7S1J869_9EUGL
MRNEQMASGAIIGRAVKGGVHSNPGVPNLPGETTVDALGSWNDCWTQSLSAARVLRFEASQGQDEILHSPTRGVSKKHNNFGGSDSRSHRSQYASAGHAGPNSRKLC